MTVLLTYDNVLSRVQVAVTGLSALADSVLVERSVNQINWTTVRGGGDLTPSSNAVSVDDYEFSANVQNYYRARAYETSPSSYVTGGPPTNGNNATLTPVQPLGYQTGDLMLVHASIRNSPTGFPNTPLGYSIVIDAANMKVFGRTVTGGAEPNPTVTFTGGVAGADTLAQAAAFRNTSLTVGNVVTQLNASAQDIARPALPVPADNMVIVAAVWKQDDWSTANQAPFTAIQGNGVTSGSGDDAGQAWSFQIQTTKTDIVASSVIIGAGGAAISRSAVAAFYHQDLELSSETGSITPTLTGTWIKVIAKPFLNRQLGCVPNQSSIKRRARGGIFDIVNRSFPIAVTDVRGSREFTIEVIAQTTSERTDLDLILATGDTYFFQSPPDDPMPTIYAAVLDTDERRPLRNRTCGNDWRVFTLPLVEIAAPTADIVGSLGTWQTVVNTYATWSDVIAAHADWASLLTLVGSTNDVIVP